MCHFNDEKELIRKKGSKLSLFCSTLKCKICSKFLDIRTFYCSCLFGPIIEVSDMHPDAEEYFFMDSSFKPKQRVFNLLILVNKELSDKPTTGISLVIFDKGVFINAVDIHGTQMV